MSRLTKILIAGTALAILPLNLACAGGSTDTGSLIINGQVNLNNDISHVTADLSHIQGDAGAQSAAAGNVLSVLTMNDTHVSNDQFSSAQTIESSLNSNISTIGGSVGLTSQAVCNSADISTDPTTTAIESTQNCSAKDPASSVNANVFNVGGDMSIASSALGNTFSSDSNAPNMPVTTAQINKSGVYSTVNAEVYGIGGSAGVTSTAIGNNAQIVHYSTN